MISRAIFDKILAEYGEDVIIGGTTMRASVQRPQETSLVQDAQEDEMMIFVSPSTLPALPEKFTRAMVRGRERSVHEAEEVRGGNVVFMYVLRVRG